MTNESLRLGNVSLTSRKLRTIILSTFLLLGIGNAWGATITFKVKDSGSSSTTYVTSETEQTTDANNGSLKYKMKNWNPSSGQVRGNQSSASNDFYIYNTDAIPGSIAQIAISGGSYTYSKIYYNTSTSAISSHTTANSMSSASATVSGTNSYFRLNFTNGATSGTQKMTNITITFSPKPKSLTNGTITATTAHLSWTDTYNTNSYDVYCSTTNSKPTANATPTATVTTKYVDLESLSGSSTYYWWVRSKITSPNSKSDWVAGNSFTTSAAASCSNAPTVTNGSLKGSVSSSSSATVQCTSGVSNIGGAGCSMTSYGFAVGTSADPTIGETLTGTGKTYEAGSSIAASTGFEKLIDGLAANTTYHVRSYATNGAGTGYGADFTFTTLAACTAVPTVTAGSKGTITSTTAAVTCSSGISSLGTGGCEITSYGFVYGTSANPTTSNSTKEVGKTYTSTGVSFNTSLTGLTEGTTYYVRPYATNGFDTGYGTQTSFSTPKITVSETAHAFGDRAVGGSYTMTFTVSGTYLQGNINIAKSGTNQAMFSIDNATVTQTDGTAPSTTITVTYSPSAAGSHSATLTLTSTNATSKTVSLTGTGKYKVTWMAGGSVFSTQVADANTALSSPGTPSPATYCPGGKVFVGWSANTIAGTSNTQPTDLFTDATKKKMPAGGITYYAVYATSTGSSSTSYAAITSGLASGNYVIAYEYNNNGTRIALQNIADNSDASNRMEAYALARDGSGKYANPSDTYIWQLQAQDGGGYYIYDLATGMYLNATTSALQLSTTPTKYDIVYDGTNSRWTIQLNSNSSYYVHGYTGTYTDFRVSTSGSDGKYRVYLYKNEGTQTFSAYATTCCTNLDDINGAITFTNPTTAVVSWDNIANVNSWTVKYKTGGGAYSTWAGDQTVYTKSTTNDSRKVTITGLTCNTAYDFQIIANPASNYCDKDETLDNSGSGYNSGKWDLDYTFSGAVLHDGDLDEGTGVLCGDLDITIEPQTIAYVLPSDVTVSIGGVTKTKDTHYTWDSSTGELHIGAANITGAVAISCTAALVGCAADPSIGAVSLKTGGTYNLGQVDVTVATSGTGAATCAWTDYGFVWSESANPTVGGSGCTKVPVGTSGDATTWEGSLTKTSFATGTTYYYRAYGKNSKDGAAFAYSSSDGTFTPRSVTFNMGNGEDNVVVYVNSGSTVGQPGDPSRTGYDFDEWQLSGSQYDFSTAVTGNITLDAVWTANEYAVTFDKNGGQNYGDDGVTATYGAAMPSYTTNPRRTGYTFTGYFDDPDDGEGTKYYNADKSSAHIWDKATDATLYAHWSPKNYTITLNNQGADTGHEGTTDISVTYDSNTNLSETPAITKPEKTGYVFAGYYTAEDGGGSKIIDEDGNVVASVSNYTSATKQWKKANDVELYTYWKRIYTVKWSVNGNDSYSDGVVPGNSQVVTGEKISDIATAPADYTLSSCASKFMGWSCKNFGSTPKTTASGQYDDLFTTTGGSPYITQDTTFYAVFAEVGGANVNDTLWYEDWKGYSNSNTPSSPNTGDGYGAVVYGSASITYTFGTSGKVTTDNGGNLAGGASPEAFVAKNGDIFGATGILPGVADSLTLQYKQNGNGLKVGISGTGYSFQLGNNTYNETLSNNVSGTKTHTIVCGSAATFSLTFTSTSSSNVRLDNILVIVKTPSYSNYRTQCDPNIVKVTYNANSGTTSCANGEHDKRNDYTVCSSAPTRDYYSFTGWLCSADGGVYQANETIDADDIDDDFTLTAQWSPVPYNITYNLNGGTNAADPITSYNVETVSALPTPTYDHKRFDGWYTDNNVWSNQVASITAGMHGNLVLYAKWTARNTIIFEVDGAQTTIYRANDENLEDAVAGQGSKPVNPAPPTACSEKVFVGWSASEIDDETDTRPGDLTNATGTVNTDKHYYAVWAIQSGTPIAAVEDNSFTTSGIESYCGMTNGMKDVGDYILKNSIWTSSNMSGVQVKIKVYHLSNSSSDVLRISLVNSSGTEVVGTDLTTTARGSNSSSAAYSSYVTLTPTSTVTGYKVALKTKNSNGSCVDKVTREVVAIYSKYSTSCCATKVTLSHNSPEHGTIAFGKTTVPTCGGDKDVSLTITPAAGYQLATYSVATGSGKVATKTDPGVSLNNNSSAAQNLTLTFAEDANGAYDVTASFTLMTVTSWTWTYNSAAIPDPLNLYVGQSARLDVAYTPSGVDATKKTYERDKDDAYINWVAGKQPTYSTISGKASTGENTTEVTFTHADGPTKTVNVKVLPLPLTHFVDLVHGKAFADVAATIEDNALSATKSTPTSDDWTTPNANTCETNHLHLVGWIRSDWPALVAYLNGTGDKPTTTAIVGAGSSYFFAPGASINVQTFDGKTFYAVWAEIK